VSVAGSLPEAEDAARQRDREETKRLLYVAVTRARERLCLAAVLKQGRFQAGGGSLGEVLPASLKDAFVRAAAGGRSVEWRAENGGVHVFGIAEPDEAGPGSGADGAGQAERSGAATAFDLEPLMDAVGARRIPAAVHAMSMASERETEADETNAPVQESIGPGRALVGTLVHRLFQATRSMADPETGWLSDRARALLAGREENAGLDSREIVAAAVEAFLRLRRRPDLSRVIDRADCEYELPFSLRLPPSAGSGADVRPIIVRGSIDCVARQADGTITVVELKTGRRHAWHECQLGLYLRAARALYPGVTVEGRLVYLGEDDTGASTIGCNRIPEARV
jgi:ATP-dependent exoDNAse (exonuclease V) beta subunit